MNPEEHDLKHDLRVLAEVRVLAERTANLTSRVSELAVDVAGCAANVASLAERMTERFVPREVFDHERRANEIQHLDMQGDHAKLAADFSGFQGEFRSYVEDERKAREARHKKVDADRTSTRRWAAGAVLAFLGSVVLPILALLVALTRGGPT